MKNISPPVFYYHSVAPRKFENWAFNFLTLPTANFEAQLALLRKKGFRTLFMKEWLDIRKAANKTTGKEVCLTFDDGLLDNWVYAFPLAKKYGMKFTLFVALEYIDHRDIIRPTLEDVWKGKVKEEDLNALGFVSWQELRLMQDSGVVDIQSHTMTHDKFPASGRITGFYYGGANGVYPTLNAFPEIKPFYLADWDFNKKLPWGTPVFEENSAVTVRKQYINTQLVHEITEKAVEFNLRQKDHRLVFEKEARRIYGRYQENQEVIVGAETEQEYQQRLQYEIIHSKKTLEEKLGKTIDFLCWPHGDNTLEAHKMARDNGYQATTAGNLQEETSKPDRIPRMGGDFRESPWLNRQKMYYKIAGHYHKQPYYAISLANDMKNRLRGKS